MSGNGSREAILNRIKRSTERIRKEQKEIPVSGGPIYHPLEEDLALSFQKNLERHNGVAVLCESTDDLKRELQHLFCKKQWKSIHSLDPELTVLLAKADIPSTSSAEDFLNMEAGITQCEFLVAHLGSVMVSSRQASGRRMNVYPPVHIVVANYSQLCPYMEDAMKAIQNKYGSDLPSLITNITGPSRTADIEKTLILGAHGPKEIYVFLRK
ncbi:MAG: lactate utilization protein C [Marinifilaceae bacterium]